MVEEVKTRTKRSQRGKPKGNVVITDDDIRIFCLLDDHRLLRTSHIAKLTGRSKHRINKRLRILKDHGYIGWINPKLERFHKPNPEDVHALANGGAKVVGEYRNKPIRHRINELNQAYKAHGVSHQLLVSDFLVSVRAACEVSDQYEYIPFEEIFSSFPAERKKSKNPLIIKAPTRRTGVEEVETTLPDAMFGIRLLDQPADRNRAIYFLEADANTMVQGARSNPDWSGVAKKYHTYYHFNRLKLHEEQFGIRGFRVLYLTTGEDLRAKNAVGATRDIHKDKEGNPIGWRQWLFSYKSHILRDHPDHDILTAPWMNGRWHDTAGDDSYSTLVS